MTKPPTQTPEEQANLVTRLRHGKDRAVADKTANDLIRKKSKNTGKSLMKMTVPVQNIKLEEPTKKLSVEERMNQEQIGFPINFNQRKFCEVWTDGAFFGDTIEAYGAAYNKDVSDPKDRNISKVGGCRLLTDVNILGYINKLLEDRGLNDEFVDKQLLIAITQNSDFRSKVDAIKHYKEFKIRLTEHTLKADVLRRQLNPNSNEDEVTKVIFNFG